MNVRLALVAGSALCLVAIVQCGQRPKPPDAGNVTPAPIGADTDHSGEGGAGGEAPAPDRHRPDPALVQKALDRSGTPTSGDEAAHGLRFEVVEIGPTQSWAMAVVNRGSETMSVVFDPRLLTLEVEAPPDPKAKKKSPKPVKPHSCRLPEELRPARADAAYVAELAPGHGLVEAFDPRLYCLPEQGISPLVSGARVTATFGWPPKTKTVWRRGKRVEEQLPITPPFVAAIAPKPPDATDAGAEASDAAVDAGESSDAGENSNNIVMKDDDQASVSGGVKELHGTPFELGADYAPPPKIVTNGLVLEVTRGSDAASEMSATVTVQLSNRSSTPERVYFRREQVTFEVSSVDGTEICDPGPDDRAPDRQAFTQLAAGGSISVTSRLIEMCPQDTFARPGLYLVRAVFDTDNSGSDFGFQAFVGHLTADRAATVRIRSGRLPFPGTRSLAEVQVGVPYQ